MTTAAVPAPTLLRRVLRRCRRTAIIFLATLGLLTLVRTVAFDLTPVISGSMAPTLQGSSTGGDWVITDMLSGYFRRPRRWEVVEFINAEGLRVMKRIVGLPGETIRIVNGQVLINGQPLARPAGVPVINYLAFGDLRTGAPQNCGAGYYVLGDDTADSQDSRYDGPVAPSRIRARAILIVWPCRRIGWVR